MKIRNNTDKNISRTSTYKQSHSPSRWKITENHFSVILLRKSNRQSSLRSSTSRDTDRNDIISKIKSGVLRVLRLSISLTPFQFPSIGGDLRIFWSYLWLKLKSPRESITGELCYQFFMNAVRLFTAWNVFPLFIHFPLWKRGKAELVLINWNHHSIGKLFYSISNINLKCHGSTYFYIRLYFYFCYIFF